MGKGRRKAPNTLVAVQAPTDSVAIHVPGSEVRAGLATMEYLLVATLLVAMGLVRFGSSLGLPFIGDDYVFLDLTRHRGLLEVLMERHTHFGWYRPWSREIHFWVLGQLAGLSVPIYRATNIALWCLAILLYYAIVRRLAGPQRAAVAALGVASLALWGATVLWISGCQDLWMLVFGLGAVLAFMTRKTVVACGLYVLALLSKETAAVIPALLTLQSALYSPAPLRTHAKRLGPFYLLTAFWLVWHPVLLGRVLGPQPAVPELTERPSLIGTLLKNVLALINLDVWPRPVEIALQDVVLTVVACALAIVFVAMVLRKVDGGEVVRGEQDASLRRGWFGAGWAVLGWLPMLSPSVGWHAYYGCLGAMGAWLGITLVPIRNSRIVAAGMVVLTCLGAAHGKTMSWDWGNEWYQRRAGALLRDIQADLMRQHPSLPRHSRVFLSHIPNNIGLVAGSSAALRIWYDDPTLRAGFLSYYRPRHPDEPTGKDYFFRLDTLSGMIEIREPVTDLAQELTWNPAWERDHQDLALVYLGARDFERAAAEFDVIARLPRRVDALVMGAVCHRLAGDSTSAARNVALAAVRLACPRDSIEAWAGNLSRQLPPRLPPPPEGSGFD